METIKKAEIPIKPIEPIKPIHLVNTPDSIESDENSDSQKCYQCKINIDEDVDSCNWLVCFRCPNWICGSCLDDIYPNFNRLDEFYCTNCN